MDDDILTQEMSSSRSNIWHILNVHVNPQTLKFQTKAHYLHVAQVTIEDVP